MTLRVGRTTRRPAHPRSGYVDDLLAYLEGVGFDGVPRPLGYDAQGRQMLTYIPGRVFDGEGPCRLSDGRLRSAGGLIRAFHDATAGWPGRGDGEVVCHSDLGPHNTVFRGDRAIALIDFDEDTGPGTRLDDFAQGVWGFADLCDTVVPVAEQAHRVRVICDAYPGMTPAAVVASLTARFERARAQHREAGRDGAVRVFADLLAWLDRHGGGLV